jgi:hypothetical protein
MDASLFYPGNVLNPPSVAAMALGTSRLVAYSLRSTLLPRKRALAQVGSTIVQTAACVYGASWFWNRCYPWSAWVIGLMPLVIVLFVALMFAKRYVMDRKETDFADQIRV